MKNHYTNRPIAVLISFFSFISIISKAQVQTPRYNTSMTPNSNGFYEYLPQGYDPNGTQTYPLLIFVHGIGELGDGSTAQLPLVLRNGPPKLINQGTFPTSFTVNNTTWKFIAISPQFIGWPTGNDVNGVISYAIQHYKVNTGKIYLTGLSMGGGTTWDYPGTSTLFANRIAALVPIAGASWPEMTRARNIAAANLPVWATHNNGDPTVPVSYTNDYITEINTAPAPTPLARKTIFTSTSHDAWTTTYNPAYKENNMNVYEWMLQYQRTFSTNQAPIADAGPDLNISLTANTVQLKGSDSWDYEGPITGFNWSYVSGPAQYTLSNSNIANPVLSNLVAGTYTFRLKVTDNQGATSTDDIVIKVVPVQTIPGRIQGEDFFAMNGINTETTGDAGGGLNVSYIDNGDWIDYNVNVSTAGTYTTNFRVAAPSAGAQFILKAQDGSTLTTINVPQTGGWQVWTTVSVPVTLTAGSQILRIYSNTSGWNFNWMEFLTGSGNQVPVVNAGAAQTITLPVSSTTLTGSATDPDGTIATYAWTQTSGTAATVSNPNSASTGISGLNTAGIRTFRLTATDNLGASSYAEVTVTVNAASGTGKPIPGRIEAESYDAMSGIQTETTGDTGGGLNVGWIDSGDWMDYNVNVAAAGNYTAAFRVASPNSGAQFQLRKQDGTILGTVSIPQTGGWQAWTTVSAVVNLPAGTQTLRILSTAAAGWNINWADFSNTVANKPPVVNAGTAQTITLPASTATLTGTATDPDGTIASYNWTQTSGTAATISSPSSASTGITGLTTAGVRTFRLTVTDNLGASAYADVTITVNAATIPSGKTIPGRIEAESFDSMNGIQTESTADAGGGLNVGWIDNGDWMDYNVNVTATGNYTAAFRVASPNTGSQFQLRRQDGSILATVNVPQTGGWQNWVTVNANVSLIAGTQTIRIASTAAAGWNINWIDFSTTAANVPPTVTAGLAQTITLPASTTTLTGTASDTDGTIVSYAWTQTGGTVATISNPNSVSTGITGLSTAGVRTFRLTVTDNAGATAYAEVTVTVIAAPTLPSGKSIPGRIEAENFDSMSGIQTESTSDAGGGQNVGWIDNGDWMDYNVNVTTTGTYTVNFRVSSPYAGQQFLLKSGSTTLLTITIPQTGGWQNWVSVSANLPLTAGAQTLRVYSLTSGWNFNWMDFAFASVASRVNGNNISTPVYDQDPVIQVYPNPVSDQLNLTVKTPLAANMDLKVYNQNGVLIKGYSIDVTRGTSMQHIAARQLAPGVYYLRIRIGNWTDVIRFVKQ